MEQIRRLTDQYQVISLNGTPCSLGFGAYGSVVLAQSIKTKKTVAVKKIFRKMASSEVNIHFSLRHPNIIRMIDYFFDEQAFCTYLVLQYAENGTLFDFIKENGIKDHTTIREIFKSCCQAINYLHSNNIMHRDIKPQNILLDKNFSVKLCDFGFASHSEPRKTLCGTVQYMSPQMIMKKTHNHKVDVWSLGILLFELIQGHAPFQAVSQQQILQKMKQPLYFSQKFYKDEIEIVHNILKVNPMERPQIHQILKMKFFKLKRHSQQVSKRSTMEDEKQSKIKITNVRELIEDNFRGSFNSSPVNPQQYFQYLNSTNQSIMRTDKISLKKKSKQI